MIEQQTVPHFTQENFVMRRVNLLIAIVVFSVISSALTLRLLAATQSNEECLASGGCSFPCFTSFTGMGSAQIICASQLPQCSPRYLSTCSSKIGNPNGVCGVYYSYSGQDCDPTTINDSYYIYDYYCVPR